jgi:hypothetical protein
MAAIWGPLSCCSCQKNQVHPIHVNNGLHNASSTFPVRAFVLGGWRSIFTARSVDAPILAGSVDAPILAGSVDASILAGRA